MFALVRFIDDDMDKRQYVIPVHDIEEFDPVDENDFNNKSAYRAKWDDPDNDINDGTYTIQILRLAVQHLLEEMSETRDDGAHGLAEFSPTPDGRFHLCKGVKVTADQVAKILKNKKATIVIRDTSQAIWGLEALALRTVSGRSVPGETTKQLTPAKVQVVQECLAYWGRMNNQDITVAAHGVLRVLSEKIQDVKKKLKLDDGAHGLAEFSPTPDGRFHLCKGVKVTAGQAAKILKNKNAMIVICDTAQAIWGLEALALRTVSGRSVPGETTKQLTSAKVQVVQECLAYWGRTNNQDITVAAHGVLRVLSEKIQDVKKKLELGKE
ncbi:hypothetical protein HPB49_008413 [Dermacentor silvarum]|uniref:Uncharacterized protein n=1 Tax=Dermacentor silvarum TaxID=543639 RepID=A0ACB8DNV3_DERSI|nr:hypothetical protein HPB49_008413 [Dermacentor silvarum]